jgi:hypothetical protein
MENFLRDNRREKQERQDGIERDRVIRRFCGPARAEGVRTTSADEEMNTITPILNGELQLFHSLILPYERGVYAMCLAILKNQADAEDASQDTILNASVTLLLSEAIPGLVPGSIALV